jgi:hypothetical protein
MRTARAAGLLACAVFCVALARADASEPPPMLLASPYGELCTMCEGYLRCSLSGESGFTVYHVKAKDFWQQVASIADWFMYAFRPHHDERRALDIYQRGSDAQGHAVYATLPGQEARLSMTDGHIEVPGGWIDRRSAAWHREKSGATGRCELLTLGEGRKISSQFGGTRP